MAYDGFVVSVVIVYVVVVVVIVVGDGGGVVVVVVVVDVVVIVVGDGGGVGGGCRPVGDKENWCSLGLTFVLICCAYKLRLLQKGCPESQPV